MVLGIKIKNPDNKLNLTQLALLGLNTFRQKSHTQDYTPAKIEINAKEREKLPPNISINGLPLVGSEELEPGYLRVVTADIEGIEEGQ